MVRNSHNVGTKKMFPAKSPIISGFFATQTAIFLCTKTQTDRKQKSICLFYYPEKEKTDMLMHPSKTASKINSDKNPKQPIKPTLFQMIF